VPVAIADSLITAVRHFDAADARRMWDFLDKLKENAAHPSLSLERIERTQEKRFWAGRISQGLRAVLYREGDTTLVLYADQHDAAYDWARTHRLERHAVTGELQIVTVPTVTPVELPSTPGIFATHDDAYLLSLGLPPDWLPVIRKVSTEDQLLEVVEGLPDDVQARLLDLASGKLVTPPVPLPAKPTLTPQPGESQRFIVIDGDDDLRRLLDAPLETWLIFLHPSQQRLATGTFRGPLKITGSAGTGKTVVALHRARHLARQGKRVLLTSFVTTLCANLERQLTLLATPEERTRITVSTVHACARRIIEAAGERVSSPTDNEVRRLLEDVYRGSTCTLAPDALELEWVTVIQAQGITSWDAYRTASRAGRGTPLSVKERKAVWDVVAQVQVSLSHRGILDYADQGRYARELLQAGRVSSPYDTVIIDEVQDLGPQELRLLAALAGDGSDALTLVGDGGQRIYARPTSLRSLGIDVRGRSHVLRLNYRTTRQIRRFADDILAGSADNLDGETDDRRGVRSLIGGPEPSRHAFTSRDEQSRFVVAQVGRLLAETLQPGDIAVFARKRDLLEPIKAALRAAGHHYHVLTQTEGPAPAINLGTMHRAKGFEFKVVFVVDVSDDQVPQRSAYQRIADPQAREETIERERHVLYVSITRARDEVYLSWVGEPSRFLPRA